MAAATETPLVHQLAGSVAAQQAKNAQANPVGLRHKLFAVMCEVSYIQKDKENQFHRYRYASEAAIKEKLHAAFVKYGILFSCDPVTHERVSGLGKDGKESITICQFHYEFEDIETGEKKEGTFFGCGADALDKGLYKAVTGAIKYILTTRFLIPTGDDPEDEPKLTTAEKKAAQKEIADKKIAELQGKGAKVHEIEPKPTPPPHPRPNTADPDPATLAMWRGMTNKPGCIAAFGQLKSLIVQVLGPRAGEADYYQILSRHGVKHANEFTSTKPARDCARELFDYIRKADEMRRAEANTAPKDFTADDDDLPAILRPPGSSEEAPQGKGGYPD